MNQTLKYNIDMSADSKWHFITTGTYARENFLYMQEVGRFISGPEYYTSREGLDSYLIKLTLYGRGILEYCGEKYTVSPGELFVIDCRKAQRYYTDPETLHWDVIWVHFTGVTAGSYYEAFMGASGGKPVAADRDGECRRLLYRLLALGESYMAGSGNDIAASVLLTELLGKCIDGCSTGNRPQVPDYVGRAAEYINEHFSEDLSLDQLSAAASVSKFHLQREFKKYMGVGPGEYLQSLRINRAKELLRGTDLPISETAEAVGMDYAYFVQVFRKSVGLTPLHYRKQWSEK